MGKYPDSVIKPDENGKHWYEYPAVTAAEIAPAAWEVTSLDNLRRFLDTLHAVWRQDPERGHSLTDDIRARVLQMCAAGHPQAADLAREVLVTDQWDDVESYCG